MEVDDVAVLDDVVAAFEPDVALGPGVLEVAGGLEVVEADDLGPDEAVGHVGVDVGGGLDGNGAAGQAAGRHLLVAGGVEGDAVEGAVDGRGHVGRVEPVQAEFRQPIASVSSSGQVRREYVDAEGVRLPASGVPMWAAVIPPTDDSELARQVYFVDREDIPPGLQARPIHYIRIDGVRELPPRQVGQCWKGDDLAAGLKLVKLIRTRPYANQITTVDVGNHARRALPSEPELRMYAQVGKGRPTDIRFGRFSVPGVRDFNIAAERKMSYLDQYVQENNGHLAGINSFIDLRYDDLTYSLN